LNPSEIIALVVKICLTQFELQSDLDEIEKERKKEAKKKTPPTKDDFDRNDMMEKDKLRKDIVIKQ
jgi:hypothetical protein